MISQVSWVQGRSWIENAAVRPMHRRKEVGYEVEDLLIRFLWIIRSLPNYLNTCVMYTTFVHDIHDPYTLFRRGESI